MYISNVTLIQAVCCIYKHKNTLFSICFINLYKTFKTLGIYKVYNRKQNMKYYLAEITHVNVQIKVNTWGRTAKLVTQ